ncbi:hypothetical protein NV379_17635 [Paenibacillus sp. N1-5-1-14]|uniref:hypothetical protein n=1 Tax=Paenibacillus radicibacter TaxID=2972488 RepID=UPI002158C4D3|nr:hypothetical protein [Paenibacillus radicibacter]MCR8644480.1 hypothetical protein [Paenibacillus radicibacter]
MAITKEDLNKLIQKLSDDVLPEAAKYLENLVSKSAQREIPWDDEPTTQDDLDVIKKAKEAFTRGDTIKLKDVVNDLLN